MPTLETKIKRVEQQIRDLQVHLSNLKRTQAGIRFAQNPQSFEPMVPSGAIEIIFDGGTSCNIPSRGFGHGYGSYQIAGGEIKRVKFGMGHSCNSAEIRTLEAALADLLTWPHPTPPHIVIKGDSKIALKWANPRHKDQPSPTSWREFHTAITMIREHLPKFASVTRIWHGRDNSVRLFGH